jgi:hypothetical protein
MNKITIKVPTIRDDESGFDKILKIASEVFSAPKNNFDFDFSNCSRLDHNGVVLLGGLARYVNYQNSMATRVLSGFFNSDALSSAGVMFKVDTMSSLISKQMISNNFLSHFSQSDFTGYPKGDYIGYREHTNLLDDESIADHLSEQWLSSEKLSLSHLLKSEIVSRIFEIFMNAYGHGASIQEISKLGVYSCGQFDPKEQKLDLTVLDFGPGIINNVEMYGPQLKSEIESMEWALKKGNTTHTDSKGTGIPRGLGFELLLEFTKVNKGKLRIYSNGVVACSNSDGIWKVYKAKYHMKGTLVSITVNCDDKHYKFSSEADESQFQHF